MIKSQELFNFLSLNETLKGNNNNKKETERTKEVNYINNSVLLKLVNNSVSLEDRARS